MTREPGQQSYRLNPAATFGVVELRRYALHPGGRDVLIPLFEREFIESQERCGMVPIGHYRDLDDPNSFVWFRGFADMETRRGALQAFYTSPAWMDHRDTANATMIDSNNVLLLRSAGPDSGFETQGLYRPASGDLATGVGRFVATSVFMLSEPATEALIAAFEERVLPEVRRHAQRIAYLVTEERRNDFPRLPVREEEHALVVVGICATDQALDGWSRAFDSGGLPESLRSQTLGSELLRLEPAPRSLFR
jgi:hypothetical protein